MSITTKKEKKQSKGVAGSGLTQKELTELKKKNPRRFEKFLDMLREGKTKQDDNLLLTPDMMKGQIGLMKEGGLAEATAKLKAKGMKAGGEVKAEMTKKDKVVSIDKSPNSGLITQRGFGASRRT